MEPILISRPEIALDDFLPIFLSSSFVLLFGLFYVAIYTLVKMERLKKCICLLHTFFGLYKHIVCILLQTKFKVMILLLKL